MAKKIDLIQGSADWHAFREEHLGASEAPIIMGASPWKTPKQFWKERMGLADKPVETSAMRRGRDMEAEALEAFNDHMDADCVPAVFESAENSFISASLDGYDAEKNIIVEIKCPGMEDHMTAQLGEIPGKYKWQLVQQMYVMDMDIAYYCSYRDGEACILTLKRDKEDEKMLIKAVKKFWRCLQDFVEPDPTERDIKDINDPEFEILAQKYLKASELAKTYKEEADEIKERMKSIAGESARGGGITLVRTFVRGNVDYKAIPILQGFDLEPYRKPPFEKWTIKEN